MSGTADEFTMQLVWTIPASRQQVFAAWTDAALLTQWMNADPAWRVSVESDARPGGKLRSEVIGPDGSIHITTGEYLELEPGAHFTVTHAYEGPQESSGRAPSLVTFGFSELTADQTEVSITHSELTSEDEREGYRAGWTDLMQTLEAFCRRQVGEGASGA